MVVVVSFTYNTTDYAPWAGTAGAADPRSKHPFQTQERTAVAAAATGDHPRVVLEPQHLDLGDAVAVAGSFGKGGRCSCRPLPVGERRVVCVAAGFSTVLFSGS